MDSHGGGHDSHIPPQCDVEGAANRPIDILVFVQLISVVCLSAHCIEQCVGVSVLHLGKFAGRCLLLPRLQGGEASIG